MKMLTAQTTIRCHARHCRYAATTRVDCEKRWDGRKYEESTIGSYCTAHARLFAIEPVETVGRSTYLWASTPLLTCPVCGAATDVDGRCSAFPNNARYASRPFSCECATCRVYGGDCNNVFAHEAAGWSVRAHAALYRVLLGRDVLTERKTHFGSEWANVLWGGDPDTRRGPGKSRVARRRRRRALTAAELALLPVCGVRRHDMESIEEAHRLADRIERATAHSYRPCRTDAFVEDGRAVLVIRNW